MVVAWLCAAGMTTNRPRKGAAQLKLELGREVDGQAGAANRPRKGAAQLKLAAPGGG